MSQSFKKTGSAIIVAAVLILSLLFSGCKTPATEPVTADVPLLRLHIRANSNETADQDVKLRVRDAVTAYLERELAAVSSLETAKKEIEKRLKSLNGICDGVLQAAGFSYASAARLTNEFFPARSYENLVVESGYYDAVIILLGDGAGDNWWCVIYPPLCYIEGKPSERFTYKSKIAELIAKYFGKNAS